MVRTEKKRRWSGILACIGEWLALGHLFSCLLIAESLKYI